MHHRDHRRGIAVSEDAGPVQRGGPGAVGESSLVFEVLSQLSDLPPGGVELPSGLLELVAKGLSGPVEPAEGASVSASGVPAAAGQFESQLVEPLGPLGSFGELLVVVVIGDGARQEGYGRRSFGGWWS